MSRSSQLPPRCPSQRKSGVRQTLEPSVINFRGVNTRHHRSLSQSSLTDDQPAWLDDLLSDSNSIPKGYHHSRSASDSVALFDGVVPSLLFSPHNDGESGNVQESGCTYGPNSPQQRSNLKFSDGTTLLSLSDYASSQSPMQFVDEIPWSCGTPHFELREDYCDAPSDLISESKSGKRHPGQRSRARKLQYISDLERTVNVFQTLESELGVRVSSLLQQKVVLSLENSKLKQQMAMLQQQKLMMDGEYQILMKEAERLKLILANSEISKIRASLGAKDSYSTDISCKSLDLGKTSFLKLISED